MTPGNCTRSCLRKPRPCANDDALYLSRRAPSPPAWAAPLRGLRELPSLAPGRIVASLHRCIVASLHRCMHCSAMQVGGDGCNHATMQSGGKTMMAGTGNGMAAGTILGGKRVPASLPLAARWRGIDNAAARQGDLRAGCQGGHAIGRPLDRFAHCQTGSLPPRPAQRAGGLAVPPGRLGHVAAWPCYSAAGAQGQRAREVAP
jgi:hypothetical protein